VNSCKYQLRVYLFLSVCHYIPESIGKRSYDDSSIKQLVCELPSAASPQFIVFALVVGVTVSQHTELNRQYLLL